LICTSYQEHVDNETLLQQISAVEYNKQVNAMSKMKTVTVMSLHAVIWDATVRKGWYSDIV